jgi:sensor c-di-GMP phosphodiesterase-like protein
LLSEIFPERINNIMSSCGVDNKKIEIEITESVFFSNMEVSSKLSKLREKSFKIALDDFGTGFSSLSKLRDLSLDAVKIEKSFIE